jgi:hypothetical protein
LAGPLKVPFSGAAIAEIPAYSQFDMIIGYPNIIGRINSGPAIAGNYASTHACVAPSPRIPLLLGIYNHLHIWQEF